MGRIVNELPDHEFQLEGEGKGIGIRITKEQQLAVKTLARSEYGYTLGDIIYLIKTGGRLFVPREQNLEKEVRELSYDELAAAWLGVAEVKPKYTSPWEAYRHYFDYKTVFFDDNNYESQLATINSFDPEGIWENRRKFYIKE